MYVNDKRRPTTVPFGSLKSGDIFAVEDEFNDSNKFYLMKTEKDDAILLAQRDGEEYRLGEIWGYSDEIEVEPLRGELSVWAR